jgi:hypothetical protein
LRQIDILKDGWDVIIVLDAMRYDHFSELHKYFFDGILEVSRSAGSCTKEWFINTFQERMPGTIYISANPFINSSKDDKRCKAARIFDRVIDVWLNHWDEHLGSVLPTSVNKVALSLEMNGRVIIHYLQPHAPYLTPRGFVYGFPNPRSQRNPLSGIGIEEESYKKLKSKIFKASSILASFLRVPNGYVFRMAEAMGLPPLSPLDATRRKYGVDGLVRAYKDNVLVALDAASRLAERFIGSGLNVVVTSDHGELLGEGGNFSHPCGSKSELLRNVPVLHVKSVKERRPEMMKLIYSTKVMLMRDKIQRSLFT